MATSGVPGKKDRISVSGRVDRFNELADSVNLDGIRELAKSDPNAAYAATQQLEAQLVQEQEAHNAQMAQLAQELDGKPEDELKTEKGLEMQAQLPFGKKQQLKNVQEMKMEIENQLRARQTSTPKPGMS